MENIRIREYQKEDFPKIIELWKKTGLWKPERDDTEASIHHCLSIGGKFLVMVGSDDDLMIGTSWLTFDGRRLHLHHFCISPEFRNKGLGTRLIYASLSYVFSSGYQVKIEVHNNNKIARHLFEKAGFVPFRDYHVCMIRDVQDIPPEKRLI